MDPIESQSAPPVAFDERILFTPEKRRVTKASSSALCLHQIFEEQARRTPDAVALVFNDDEVSYGRLNAEANRLARHFVALGVRPDSRVAIALDRGPDMLVALLATLKAGGAYVPLDPVYPAERLAFIIEDSAPVALVSQPDILARLGTPPQGLPIVQFGAETPWADLAAENLAPRALGLTPSHLAYVIYTSGTTGRPKGVLIEHANVTRLFSATKSSFNFSADDVWTLFHSVAFDFSVWEIFGALLHGGRLVIAPLPVARAPEDFYRLLCERRVTVLNQTPSAFYPLIAAQAASPLTHALRLVIFGGEALETSALKRWYDRNGGRTQLVNGYGITETAVFSTFHPLNAWEVAHGGASPIGSPISDVFLYLLDVDGKPVAIGETGEIYIGGESVARGYLNRPELTEQRFLPDPFAAEAGEAKTRMYRSGDLGRWREDGRLDYLGRNDQQVKIRGFRIELGEIEAKLRDFGGLAECAVIAREDEPGDKRLVAYYTGIDAQTPLAASDMRRFLATLLPEYMVPAAYVRLERLPLTPNGKLDRSALPAPRDAAGSSNAFEAPEGPVESALAALWSQLLRLERVGRHDNFFEIGGNSLLAARMVSQFRAQTGLILPLTALFQSPTISQVADYLRDSAPAAQTWCQFRSAVGQPNLFMVHGLGGAAFELRELAHRIDPLNVYAFNSLGLNPLCQPHRRIGDMAAHYVEEALAIQPTGPYLLCGYSFGGLIAYEMALQLTRLGHKVASLILLDTSVHPRFLPAAKRLAFTGDAFVKFVGKLWRLPSREKLPYLRERLSVSALLSGNAGYLASRFVDAELSTVQIVRDANTEAYDAYDPPFSSLDLHFLHAISRPISLHDSLPTWRSRTTGTVAVHEIPVEHTDLIADAGLDHVARVIDQIVARDLGAAELLSVDVQD